ncbi:MAG: hypothetical protein OXC82_11110 [Rhodobacteraceae bacterium]|nr:hypothetical protein [Paracoccaceae bacterium]MCY4250964.1 hypothetical protein [Paracoccaceae bacterium]
MILVFMMLGVRKGLTLSVGGKHDQMVRLHGSRARGFHPCLRAVPKTSIITARL